MMELPLYNNVDEIREAARSCTACARSAERRQVVFGHGNPEADLMLVGEAPSAADDSTGLPFTGPAGTLLDEVLAEAGVERRQLWITNLVRCYAGRIREGRPENRPVRANEVSACSRWLNLEIQYVNPKVILAIGAPAARAIIGRDFRLTEQRGSIIELPAGRLAIATIQPAYVMRLGNLIDQEAYDSARQLLATDIRLAARTAGLA